MRNIQRLYSNEGLTLIELIVTMCISGVLLVSMVSGVTFLERFLSRWEQRDRLAEEAVAIRADIVPRLRDAVAIRLSPESLKVRTRRGMHAYSWTEGQILSQGHPVTGIGYRVDAVSLEIVTSLSAGAVQHSPSDSTRLTPGLLRMAFTLSNGHTTERISFVVRNSYVYFTNHP